jgi:hypothetical protein
MDGKLRTLHQASRIGGTQAVRASRLILAVSKNIFPFPKIRVNAFLVLNKAINLVEKLYEKCVISIPCNVSIDFT